MRFKNWLKSRTAIFIAIAIAVFFIGFMVHGYLAYPPVKETKETQVSNTETVGKTNTDETKGKKEGEGDNKPPPPTPWYKNVRLQTGIALSLPLLVVLAFSLYLFLSATAKNKRGDLKETEEEVGVKPEGEKTFKVIALTAITHPATFLLFGLVVINWMVWAGWPEFWNSLWNLQWKFWAVNVGIWFALLLRLIKKSETVEKTKDKKDAKTEERKIHPMALGISRAMMFFALAILLQHVWSFRFPDKPKKDPIDRKNIAEQADTTPIRLIFWPPKELALPDICDCESGDGTPGSRKQFYPGTTEVVRGKNDTEDPSDDDIGTAQINLKHRAKEIEETKADVFTEKGNLQVAEVIYDKEGPYGGWEATRHCWEPKLLKILSQRELPLIVKEVPVDEFGSRLITKGFFFSWEDSEGSFIIRNDKKAEAIFDPEYNEFEDLPGKSYTVEFRSLTDKPAIAKIRLSRTPYRYR